MPSHKFSNQYLKILRAVDGKQVDYWDAQTSGLVLRVSPSGTKTFCFNYTNPGNRAIRLKLGRYPALSLAEARELVRQKQAMLHNGLDPAAEKQKISTQYLNDLFPIVLERYATEYVRCKLKRAEEYLSLIRNHFGTQWTKVPIRQISRRDINRAIVESQARQTPGATNNAVAALRAFFGWAADQGIVELNPCQGIGLPNKVRVRDRVLTDDEISKIWNAAMVVGYPYGHIVRLLLLTGQRRSEVAGILWSELDCATGTWTLSKDRTKARRKHIVPLCSLARQLISEVPKTNCDLLFPSHSNSTPVSGFSKWKTELDCACDVKNWTLHDLRRTAASRMASLNVQPHIIERILNHSTGGLTQLAQTYNVYGYTAELRQALDSYDEFLMTLISVHKNHVAA